MGAFPGGSAGKNPLAIARDVILISGLGRSPGRGHGNPLQYSCLENPMDRGAWWATVCGVAKNQTQLKQLSTHACLLKISSVFLFPFHFLLLRVKHLGSRTFHSKCVYGGIKKSHHACPRKQIYDVVFAFQGDFQHRDSLLQSKNNRSLSLSVKRMKEKSEKAGLKLNIQKTKIMSSGQTTSWNSSHPH